MPAIPSAGGNSQTASSEDFQVFVSVDSALGASKSSDDVYGGLDGISAVFDGLNKCIEASESNTSIGTG